MKKLFTLVIGFAVTTAILTGCAKPVSAPATNETEQTKETDSAAENTSAGDPNKKALLVISFGTSYNDTRDKTIGAIEEDMKAAFPDYDVKRAFTSQTIIDKLAKRDNLIIDNVTQAMDNLVAEGYGTVLCQPTHVMNGYEYDDVVAEITPYTSQFHSLKIGKPLLSSANDYAALTNALKESLPPIAAEDALIFMGHGTTHPADSAYAALAYQFQIQKMNNFFVGTVEGFPDFDTIMTEVKELDPSKVYLTPLMVVAGDHATKDMAGDEEDSWKTKLKAEGFEVEPILKGLGEYPAVRQLYVAHARNAMEEKNGEVEE